MKKILLLLALSPILTLNAMDLDGPIVGEFVALEHLPKGGAHVEVINDNNFSNKISQGYSVVDFYADWCGPCRIYGPRFFKVANELHTLLPFYKVNTDNSWTTASNANVCAIPTTILYKDGVEVKRAIGAMTEQGLRDFILSEVSN
jgi:thioredoxin 1